MAEDKGSIVSSKGRASIPKMQPLQNSITEKKGAPIPAMQPVTKTQSGSGPGNSGKTSGQTESGKSKQ